MGRLRNLSVTAILAMVTVLPLRAAMVVEYDFDEGSGTTAVDQMGTSQNAILATEVSYTNDVTVGNWAVNLGSGHADIGMLRLYDNTNGDSAFTVAGWWKFDNITNPAQMRFLFANSNTGSGSSGIRIFVNNYNTSNRKIRVETANGTVSDSAETLPGAFPADGQYHHVACVIRCPQNATTGTAEIYVDGVKQPLVNDDNTIRADFSKYVWTRIGKTVNGYYPTFGKLDDFRFYNEALSDSAIALLAWKYDVWQSLRVGSGGFLQQVLYCPSDPNRMYMLGDVGGIFRSDNRGTTWRMIHNTFPVTNTTYCVRSMLVDPTDANKLIAAVGQKAYPSSGRIFVSNDGGDTWTMSANPGRIEGDGQFRHAGEMLARDPADPQRILAGRIGNYLMVSTDGGNTWTNTPLPENVVPSALVFDRRAGTGTVWLCSPSGWNPSGGTLSYTAGLFRSSDNGATWNRLYTPTDSTQVPKELMQDPVDPDLLWGLFSGAAQVKCSTDGGATWTPCITGLATYPGTGASRANGMFGSITAIGDTVVLGGWGCHNYTFNRSTQSWSEVALATPPVADGLWWGRYGRIGVPAHFGCTLSYLTADPRNTNNWSFTDWYGMYQSTNSGNSWRLAVDGVEMTVTHMVAQEPDNDMAVHVGFGDTGYFRSMNGNQKLESITNPITNNVKCISASRVNPGRLYASSNAPDALTVPVTANQLFVSNDSGATWATCRMPVNTATWKKTHPCNSILADPVVPDRVWMGISGDLTGTFGDGGLYCSDDAGNTWDLVSMPTTEAGKGFFRRPIFDGHQEVAVDANGSIVVCSVGTRRLLAKPYNSENWHEVTFPWFAWDKPNTVVADPTTPGLFYVAMQYSGLYRSTDAGLTWFKIIDESVWHVSVDLSNSRTETPRRIAVVTAKTVALSADGGNTWRKFPETLPYRSPRNVVAFSGEQIVVGTTGNGAFRSKISDLQDEATSLAPASVLKMRAYELVPETPSDDGTDSQ